MRESKMKRSSQIVAVMVLLAGSCVAQMKDVPPPPKPADEGPSLQVTMKFIQEKIENVGPVNFVAYYHDNIAGNDWAVQFMNQISRVSADPSTCRIDYHLYLQRAGQKVFDLDKWLGLKDIVNIEVMPLSQDFKGLSTKQGHPSWDNRIDPPVFGLYAEGEKIGRHYFEFSDEQMADRVAKALQHAVELCGGGTKPEPF